MTLTDGDKVRLRNGEVVFIDHQPATRTRPAFYRSRCHSYRFDLAGKADAGARFDVVAVLPPKP